MTHWLTDDPAPPEEPEYGIGWLLASAFFCGVLVAFVLFELTK